MPECTPEQFAAAQRAVVVAAAGCGKTELIVRAIASDTAQRDLVLTHTHAGVRALSDRLKRARITHDRAVVDTIAGWALRLAASYPKLSGLATTTPKADEWSLVYDAAAQALQVPALRSMLRNSYSGIYVDEYQDCSRRQHALVTTLAELLPCRVVGDPLQSIFDFGTDSLVSWSEDVYPFFDTLPDLTTPHRWRERPELASWVTYARKQIQAGEPIVLEPNVLERWDSDFTTLAGRLRQLRVTLPPDRTLAVITGFPAQVHGLAKRTKGFQGLEPVDCPDLFKWAAALDAVSPSAKAAALVTIAGDCFTGFGSADKDALTAVAHGAKAPATKGKLRAISQAVAVFARSGTSADLKGAIDAMSDTKQHGGRLHRVEAWRELAGSVDSLVRGVHPSIAAAAWERRQRLRSHGRKSPRHCIGRPVLVKGLEFSDVVIADTKQFGPEDLYVAVTRASHRLVIVSSERELPMSGR